MPIRQASPSFEPPPTPVSVPGGLGRSAWVVGAALLGLIAAAYHGVLHDPFLFDDYPAILRNRTLGSFAAALHPPVNTTVSGRPLLNLSFALNRALWGDSLPAYHLVNLAILAGCALFLFGLVRRTLAQMGGEWARGAALTAGAVALIWAVHPLQTEAVTYIVQRAESLMSLCYLAALYGVARAAAPSAGPGAARSWSMIAVAAVWLGTTAKENIASVPVVAFAFDAIFFSGNWRETLRRRWPMYAAMAASWILLALLVASTHGRSGDLTLTAKFGWARFLRTQAYGIMHYLRLSFWPTRQILDYGPYWIDAPLRWAPAAIAVVALGVGSLVALFRARPIGWLGLWFFSMHAPTSLVPGARQTLAEHRMFLALAPVVILVVAALARWLGNRAGLAYAACAVALAAATERRNRVYASDYSVWSDVVAKVPTNPYAQYNLGHDFFEMGRFPEAEASLRVSVQLDPTADEPWSNLGVVEEQRGELDDAEAAYRHALADNPRSAPALNDYANLLIATGRVPQATRNLQQAIALDPDYADAHCDYGNALVLAGKLEEAEAQYRRTLELNPGSEQAHNGLGTVLLKRRQWEAARAEFARAMALNPRLGLAYANDAEALIGLGRVPEALAAYRQAEADDPNSANFRFNHGNAVFHTGDYAGAAALFAEAARLQPSMAQAHFNWAVCLLKLGRPAEALAQFEVVERLNPQFAGLNQAVAATKRALSSP